MVDRRGKRGEKKYTTKSSRHIHGNKERRKKKKKDRRKRK